MSDEWTEARFTAKAQSIISFPSGLLVGQRYVLRERIVDLLKEVTAGVRAQLAMSHQENERLKQKLAYYEAPLPMGKGNCYHRFTDEGICVRCGEDAEEWDAGCVEEVVEDLKSVVHPDFVEALARLIGDKLGGPIDTINKYLTRIEYFSAQFKWDEPEQEKPPLNNWPDNFELTL